MTTCLVVSKSTRKRRRNLNHQDQKAAALSLVQDSVTPYVQARLKPTVLSKQMFAKHTKTLAETASTWSPGTISRAALAAFPPGKMLSTMTVLSFSARVLAAM
jgi:hypothetical protein